MRVSISNMNRIVVVPLIIMGWHVFEFFYTEPFIVRVALALSFDALVYVVFHLVKEDDVKQQQKIKRAVYCTLAVMIVFQCYVNIAAYIQLMNWPRAVVSGLIFPTIASLLSYIAIERQQKKEQIIRVQEQKERRKIKRKVSPKPTAKAPVEQPKKESNEQPKSALKSASVSAKDWTGELVTEDDVIAAYKADLDKSVFSGCRNRASVNRWWKKIENQKLAEAA